MRPYLFDLTADLAALELLESLLQRVELAPLGRHLPLEVRGGGLVRAGGRREQAAAALSGEVDRQSGRPLAGRQGDGLVRKLYAVGENRS